VPVNAAIIWAFTTDENRGRPKSVSNNTLLTISAFAGLGICGLRTRPAVIKYRKAWKRAAIVWAFTYEAGRGRPKNGSFHPFLTISAFADLGISGLRNRPEVRRYRKAWARAIEAGYATNVKPGDTPHAG
jgi:hypothetical protein